MKSIDQLAATIVKITEHIESFSREEQKLVLEFVIKYLAAVEEAIG